MMSQQRISHITPAEWEGLFATNAITSPTGDVPVNLIAKGKLQKALITSRQVMGVIREPVAPTPPTSTALVATSAAGSSGHDPLTTVNVNDVIAQGVEPVRVPLMSDEDFRETM